MTVEVKIIDALAKKGPLLGKELHALLPAESYLALWQACFTSQSIQLSFFSRYYLRYDITREDQVRLSPSILRDFLSFTLMSLPGQRDLVIERQATLSNTHREISMWKIAIATNVLTTVLSTLPASSQALFCAFIAGDLAYFLGHSEPREVESIGEQVSGSDIDIIILHDEAPAADIQKVDALMTRQKSYYLRHPSFRQEIDFICKSKHKMYDQFHYATIHEKIASKIAYESIFLAGSVALYAEVKDRMQSSGVNRLIEMDFEHGLLDRKTAMKRLLNADPTALDREMESLFFFSQERVEFS
ncbi:MAG TPA: hypothetical protein DCZ49_07255 [Hyphomonadaceae bacterium]|nr:hypothetical protein [Hyphomonadaceae bacterium]